MQTDAKKAARLIRYEPTMWCDSTLLGWATIRFAGPLVIARIAILRAHPRAPILADLPSCIVLTEAEREHWESDVINALTNAEVTP
jgi:hypothetical protein